MLKRQEADITFGLGRGAGRGSASVIPRSNWNRCTLRQCGLCISRNMCDPKSPWHDQRVRLAANHAIDKQAINEAETLGLFEDHWHVLSHASSDFALPIEPYAYDPAKAKATAQGGWLSQRL